MASKKIDTEVPHMRDLITCLQCGYCNAYCPVANVKGWESFAPRGKVFWLRKIGRRSFIDDIVGIKAISNDELMKSVYSCTLCGRCEAICHVNIKFSEFWEEVREWLVMNGYGPPESQRDMVQKVFDEKFQNPFSEPLEKRDEWYKDSIESKEVAEVVYYPGCQTSYYEYKLLLNMIKIMKAAGVDFTIMGTKESCCGALNYMSGQMKDFGKIAKHNTDLIRSAKAGIMVTNCPGCYRSFKKYPKFIGDLGFEVKHSMEFIWELIRTGKLLLKKEFKSKNLPIAYHDPCELGRLSGIYDEPRNILKSVPGIDDIVEFYDARMMSGCCGGGGGLKAVDFDLSSNITLKKVQELMDRDIASVATACPTCKVQLSTAVSMLLDLYKDKDGPKPRKINVFDVVDIVAKAI